jgi:protein TonB
MLAKLPTPENVATDRKKEHVSGGRLIKRVNASYPAAARQAHIQGAVVLCAKISKDGIVQNVRALFGPPELIPAAVEAAEQWRYQPYRVNKDPVEVDTEIRMDFTLPR